MTIWCHWPSVAFGSYLEMLPISLPHFSCFAQRRPTRMPSGCGRELGRRGDELQLKLQGLASRDVRRSRGVPGGPVPAEADVALALGFELEADAAVCADLRSRLERRGAGLRVAGRPLLRRRSDVVAVPDDERLREVARVRGRGGAGRCDGACGTGCSIRSVRRVRVGAVLRRSEAPGEEDGRQARNQENRAILLSIHARGHTARARRNQSCGSLGRGRVGAGAPAPARPSCCFSAAPSPSPLFLGPRAPPPILPGEQDETR